MKLYVLIRKDLSPSQMAVQAGHAVAEFLIKNSNIKWKNGTLVYLGVTDLNDLEKWIFKLDIKRIKWTGFKEPDMNNEYTAIACEDCGKIFSKLQLI